MNQQAILQSNLLDIIFENRNKDYGAYKLRKTYQGRLGIAVFFSVGLVLILSLFLLTVDAPAVFVPAHTGTFVPVTKISRLPELPQRENKKITKQHTAIKSIQETEKPPLITASDNINSLPATPAEIKPSFTGADVQGMNLPLDMDGAGGGGLDEIAVTTRLDLPGPGNSAAGENAEIMPQYPGGIQALLSFLKKNIHSPGAVEEGEDVTVKIKFVVNYDGNLENFIVVTSGGAIFDNEVLRVLKKMPVWIPGKSRGKNVSVYYMVPVKFTSEF